MKNYDIRKGFHIGGSVSVVKRSCYLVGPPPLRRRPRLLSDQFVQNALQSYFGLVGLLFEFLDFQF